MSLHLGVMALCALCVSAVFAVIQRDDAGAQLKFGGQIFGALVGGAVVLGLLQYVFFR